MSAQIKAYVNSIRDAGLERTATKAQGMDHRVSWDSSFSSVGIGEPALQMDFSEVFIPRSTSAPIARVLSVEAVTDMARSILGHDPDIKQPVEVDEGDTTPAQEYSLIAMLLAPALALPA